MRVLVPLVLALVGLASPALADRSILAAQDIYCTFEPAFRARPIFLSRVDMDTFSEGPSMWSVEERGQRVSLVGDQFTIVIESTREQYDFELQESVIRVSILDKLGHSYSGFCKAWFPEDAEEDAQ